MHFNTKFNVVCNLTYTTKIILYNRLLNRDIEGYDFKLNYFYTELTVCVDNFRSGVIAEDGVKISAMYYSGEPVESSVVKFNEYGTNATRLHNLMVERLAGVNDGKKANCMRMT